MMTFKTVAIIALIFIVVVVGMMYLLTPISISTAKDGAPVMSYLKEKKAECNKCIETNSPLFQTCDLNSTDAVCREIMNTVCNEKCMVLFVGWG